MRKRIVILLTGLLTVFLLSTHAPNCLAAPLTWNQVNTSGFGDTKNYSAYRMTTYNNSVYVGIWGDNGAQVWGYDGSTWSNQTPSWDANNSGVNSMVVFSSKLYVGTYNGTTGAEIWEYDGSTWTQVNIDGFGSASNYAPDSMAGYNSYLYVGMGNSAGVGVWRYDGGTTWTQVNSEGFGDGYNYRSHCMAVFGGKLYVGTENGTTGTEVWEYDGSTWTQVNTDGFADSYYNPLSMSMAVYGSYLYVGTNNINNGAEVWRTAGTGGPPFTDWTQVNTDAFGDFNNSTAKSMAVYNGMLYVGTENSTAGGEVWESGGIGGPPFTDWTLANSSGFGDLKNIYINSMALLGNRLFVGTYNDVTGTQIWANDVTQLSIDTKDMFLSPIANWYPCPGSVVITEGNPPTIFAETDIRLIIPANLNTTWDVTGWGTISGTAAAKIDQNVSSVTYEDGNRTLVIDVTSDFAAGDDLQIEYICRSITQTGTSSGVTGNVGLSVDGDSTSETTNPYAWTVAVISLSSAANQTFQVGDPSTAMSQVTITDDATNATIKAGTSIQLQIPSAFNMTWDTSITTAVIGGTASAKVSSSVTYGGNDKIVYLTANTDFSPGESFTVSGLNFTNFTDVSSTMNLMMETNWFAAAYDDKTIEIAGSLDSDGDSMPDSWETTNFGNLDHDGTADTDGDGLTDLQEYQNSTDPNDADSDRDNYSDGEEVTNGKSPNDSGDKPQYSAGDYYAAADNSLWGDGTESNPWNLHTAIHHINEGPAGTYTLNVAAGTYTVTGATEPDEYVIVMQDNVTIQGAGTGGTILDGTGAATWLVGIDIEASNVIIKDLSVKSFQSVGINIYSGTGNVIQTCTVHDNLYYGILVESSASGNIIWNNCEIYRNGLGGIYISGSNDNRIYKNAASIYDNYGWGIAIGDGADNNLIYDNRIYWSGDTIYTQMIGIGLYTAGSGNQIYRNEIHGHSNLVGDSGIYIEDSSPVISQNRLSDNSNGISVYDLGGSASPTIWNNLIHDTGSNRQDYGIYLYSEVASTINPTIYHNTIDRGSLDGIYIGVGSGGNATPDIKYNIITNFTQYGISNSGGNPTIDYNDLYGNTTHYNGCTAGANDISNDPLFVASGDYHLQSNSPCIDTISSDIITVDLPGYSRPKDSGYDMGAFEFVSDITHDSSLPGGTGVVTDYRIFTVPVELKTGAALKAQMEAALGPYDRRVWRVFTWDGTSSSYIEMDNPLFADLPIYPGMAFWIISTGTDPVSFSGRPAPDGSYVRVPLTPGWNMVALPWATTSIGLDNIGVSDGINTYLITSAANTVTQTVVWDYTGSGPYSGYERLATGSSLLPGKGYWINVTAGVKAIMLIPRDNLGGYFGVSSYGGTSRSTTITDSDDEPPSPPGMSINLSHGSSGGTATPSSKGCFIATAAYGSLLHPHVKTLRAFRDSYLLNNAPGRKFVALYYRFSPPLAEIIAENPTLKQLTRLLLLPLIGFSAFILYTDLILKCTLLFVLSLGLFGVNFARLRLRQVKI